MADFLRLVFVMKIAKVVYTQETIVTYTNSIPTTRVIYDRVLNE